MATDVAETTGPRDKRLLGELLLEAGLVSRQGLSAGLAEQRQRGGRLGFNLMRLGRVTPAEFHLYLQENFQTLAPELGAPLRESPPIDLIPPRVAHHYGMLPLEAEDGVLKLALAAADAPRLIAAVEELTGLRVDPVVWPPAAIRAALARFYPSEVETGVVHKPAGDNLLVLSDRGRGIRPLRPDNVRPDAPAVDWLRSILSEAVCRSARRVVVESGPGRPRVTLRRELEARQELTVPPGALAGVAALIETLARLGSRGRVVPREGRFAADIEDRRLRVSAAALPGLAGESYELYLRDERVVQPERGEIAAEAPALAARLDRLVEDRRGLLVIAGADRGDIDAGLHAIATLLAGRLRGVIFEPVMALAGWQTAAFAAAASPMAERGGTPHAAGLERALATLPDLIVMPDVVSIDGAHAVRAQAAERIVVAPIEAADAFAAAERLARGGQFAVGDEAALVAGILGVRLMEPLCPSCRRSCDVADLLAHGPRRPYRPAVEYAVSSGCPACRGAAAPALLPVFEFLEADQGERLFRPGIAAATLRSGRLRLGMKTMFVAGLEKAAAGLLDVREPLRLLLHEQC